MNWEHLCRETRASSWKVCESTCVQNSIHCVRVYGPPKLRPFTQKNSCVLRNLVGEHSLHTYWLFHKDSHVSCTVNGEMHKLWQIMYSSWAAPCMCISNMCAGDLPSDNLSLVNFVHACKPQWHSPKMHTFVLHAGCFLTHSLIGPWYVCVWAFLFVSSWVSQCCHQ